MGAVRGGECGGGGGGGYGGGGGGELLSIRRRLDGELGEEEEDDGDGNREGGSVLFVRPWRNGYIAPQCSVLFFFFLSISFSLLALNEAQLLLACWLLVGWLVGRMGWMGWGFSFRLSGGWCWS